MTYVNSVAGGPALIDVGSVTRSVVDVPVTVPPAVVTAYPPRCGHAFE